MNQQAVNAVINSVLDNMDCEELRLDKSQRIKQGLDPTYVLNMLDNLADDIRKASYRKGRLPSNYFYFWSSAIKQIQDQIKDTMIVVPPN